MTYQITEETVLSQRVRKLKDTFQATPVRLSTERFKAVLEAYKETDGEVPIIRRAKVFEKYLKGMTLYIDDNPIVGSLTQYPRGVNPYPEWACEYMAKEGREEDGLATSFGRIKLSEDEVKLLRDTITYFKDKTLVAKVNEIFAETHPGLTRPALAKERVWVDSPAMPLGYISVDYGKVLTKGLEGVIGEAKQELIKLTPLLEDLQKMDFYKGVIIACEAVISWAHRYASLAEQMADREEDPERREELRQIAETCRWVPAKPARGFREAVQSFWFVHAAAWIEGAQAAISPGRFTQYMYPCYNEDKERGRISEDEAIELLELLFIKFSEIGQQHAVRGFYGSNQHTGQNLNIGGFTADGEDATNELDFLVLEADKRIQMIQPSTVCVWHNKLSDDFLMKCAEVVKTGTGKPAFINGPTAVERNLDRYRCSVEEARDFAVVGCTQTFPNHKTNNAWETMIAVPKMLELALNNGKNPLTGNQIGPQTGEAAKFQSYEQLHEAVKKQMEYFVRLGRDVDRASLSLNSMLLPLPFATALIDDCIKLGKDLLGGGARYGGDNVDPVGMVDLGNSMAAIKKLVFEEKKSTIAELKRALAANFEGYEEIWKMCTDAPKYGNGDDYADQVVKDWYDEFYEASQCYKSHLGLDDGRPMAVVVTLHYLCGRYVGALPSGRKAGTPLTDGIMSASPGTDKNGPTALIRSAAKVLDPLKYDGGIFNVKFHPTVVADKGGMRKLLALIKTFMDLGGYHIQFNIVSAETLRDAQQHPENYKNLVVRVAGFSAFFVQLEPAVQDEIIRRTELRY